MNGSVRDPDVENLALANDIVQAAHDFFHWSNPIPDVHPVQIDVVGLQSFQTGFQCLHHALAVIARRIGIVAGRGVGVFCRQNNTVAMALDELTTNVSLVPPV
jgi:hypothetical protein